VEVPRVAILFSAPSPSFAEVTAPEFGLLARAPRPNHTVHLRLPQVDQGHAMQRYTAVGEGDRYAVGTHVDNLTGRKGTAAEIKRNRLIHGRRARDHRVAFAERDGRNLNAGRILSPDRRRL
jgi:hypothetical protein